MLPQPYLAGNLNAVLAWLRSHDAIADEDLHLPPRSGLPALVRRLQLSLDTVPAPSPGFKLAAPYRQIATIGELRAIGATLGNCVASPRMFANDYWFRLVDGSTIYITRDEPPLLLAALRRVGPGLWQLDQVGGRKGDTVGRMEYDQLSEALRSAGVTVLKEDPGHAFANLWSHVKRRSDPHQDLEDLEVAGVEPEIDF